jgi:formylmethanofuran dehydrogenase subunit A
MSDSNGEWYQVIEELQCPFKEKDTYIILKDGEIIYWQKSNNYYQDMKVNLEIFKKSIEELELTNYRSQVRKDKTLVFLRETLNKMIAHKRQIKIEEVLDKTPKESVWLAC